MTLDAVSTATGIEPSRIRFFQSEFGELLAGVASAAAADRFDEHSVALLTLLDRWVFAEGKSVFDIRRELGRERQSGGAPRVIAVTSGKGGVGKTTVAVNLAIALAEPGRRTLLIDADMGLANVHVLTGIQPSGTMLDVVEQRATLEQILADGPGGIRVLCGASGVPELADLDPRRVDRLLDDVARLAGRFDAVVIDTAAGISAQVTRFLRAADDIVVVTTPNIAATLDAYGMIKVVREAGMPGQVRVLVNMAGSNAQGTSVYERLRDCAQRFLRFAPEMLGQLRKHSAVERANQNRRPLMLEAPDSVNARRFRQMAGALPAAPVASRALPLDLFVGSPVRRLQCAV